MKSGKLITGIAVGAVVALIMIPKTRKMITEAVASLTDSFKDILDKTNNMAEEGTKSLNKIADNGSNIAGGINKTKEAWQS